MRIKMEVVNVVDIKPDPNQPRKKFDKDAISNLAKTIHGHKIINPIEIDENNMIITGELRWRALKEAGTERVLVKRITELEDWKRKERQLIENIHQQNLTSPEKKEAFQVLFDTGKYKDGVELAEITGVNERWVNHFLKYKEIEEEIGEDKALKLGETKTFEIREKVKTKEDRKKIAEKAVEEKLTRDQIREVAKVIKKVPKDVKEEILKPKSEITIEEAKEVAEFPKPEQRKIVMDQIKKTKQMTNKIIQEEKAIAKKEKPMPVIKVENIDQKKVDRMNDIFFKITQEYRKQDIQEYNGITQEKCIKIMRNAYQFIFKELEKW